MRCEVIYLSPNASDASSEALGLTHEPSLEHSHNSLKRPWQHYCCWSKGQRSHWDWCTGDDDRIHNSKFTWSWLQEEILTLWCWIRIKLHLSLLPFNSLAVWTLKWEQKLSKRGQIHNSYQVIKSNWWLQVLKCSDHVNCGKLTLTPPEWKQGSDERWDILTLTWTHLTWSWLHHPNESSHSPFCFFISRRDGMLIRAFAAAAAGEPQKSWSVYLLMF